MQIRRPWNPSAPPLDCSASSPILRHTFPYPHTHPTPVPALCRKRRNGQCDVVALLQLLLLLLLQLLRYGKPETHPPIRTCRAADMLRDRHAVLQRLQRLQVGSSARFKAAGRGE